MVRRYTKEEVDQILHSRTPEFISDDGIDPGLPGSVPPPLPGDALVDKVLSAAGRWITQGEAGSGNLNAYTLKSDTLAISSGLQLTKAAVTTVAAISAGLDTRLNATITRVETAAISAGLDTRINTKISTGLGSAGNWNNVIVSADGIVTSGAYVSYGGSVDLSPYTLRTETALVSSGLQLTKTAVTTVAAISAGLNTRIGTIEGSYITSAAVSALSGQLTTRVETAAISAGLDTRINTKISTGLGFAGNWNRVVVNSDGIVTSGANVAVSGSGVSSFTSLTDAPSSFFGYAGRSLIVNTSETALEYFTPMDALNVKDFGAYGDDVSRPLTTDQAAAYNSRYGSFGLAATSGDFNDWAAIQGTLLKAAYTGQQTYLPVGTYRVNKPLALNWTATPATSATGYPLNTRVIGAGLRTVIKSYSITAGRGSVEFLGESNPISVNMELAHMTIKQDVSCAYNSYCLRVGDAWCGFKGYRLNLEGAQALALKVASSVSYANLCTNFEQCRFWTNYGYAWFPNDDLATTFCVAADTGGAFWDNVKFTSCMFHGLVQPRAFILDFDNCQFFVNPKRPTDSGYDFAINCYLYLGGATFNSCYFEDHKIGISAASFTADIRPIFIKSCHFSGVTNFPSGASFVESAIRAFPSVNGVVGTIMIEGCSFGDDLYLAGSIDVGGCTLIERGSYNITQPGKPITRNVPFTVGEWDNQDYTPGDGLISNRTSNYHVDRFKKIDVVSTSLTSVHTSGGILADIAMSSPNMVASRPYDNGSGPGSVWGVGATNSGANDNMLLSWSSTAYTTGGVVPWIENDNAHLYIPNGKRLRIGFGVDPLAYTDIDSVGIDVPNGEVRAPFHSVRRYATGTENAGLWYTAVEDASGNNQLIIGNTSTTYSTGGVLTWIGNNQPFINTSLTKGLKIGFATLPVPYHFQYNRLDVPGDIIASAGVMSAPFHTVSRYGTGTENSSIWYTAVEDASGNNQLIIGNSSTTYSTGGALTWIGNNQPFINTSVEKGLKIGFVTQPTPYHFQYNRFDVPGDIFVGGGIGVNNIQVSTTATITGKLFSDNLKSGGGHPEGAITGVVGDIFQRTDGAVGNTIYIKEVGSGNTGWTAIGAGSTGGSSLSGGVAGKVAIWSGTTNISASSQITETSTGIQFSSLITSANVKNGSGTPEGSVSADVGSIYQRTNGTPDQTLYVKESGSGNTGWQPLISTASVASISAALASTGVIALTDAATIATDASLGSVYTVTITASRTMGNPTNSAAGKKILYQIRQDGVGGHTMAWDTNFRFSADVPSPTLSTSANLTDYIGFIYNGISSKWDCLATSLGY